MARPTKQGVDYFPVDVNFDDKIELFISENGASGLGVLIVIWQLIYQNEGYFIKNGDDLCLLVRRRVMADVSDIKTIIESAINRGIFDQSKYSKYNILTSSGIQKRYFVAAKKKRAVMVDGNYICSGVSVGENTISTGIDSGGNSTKEEVEEEVEEEGEEEVEKIPTCPHLEIVKSYNSILGAFLNPVKPKLWNGTRKKNLTSRWREDEERQDITWWNNLFDGISKSSFLTGENNRQWKADLGWILNKTNIVKIIEGKFNDRKGASEWM